MGRISALTELTSLASNDYLIVLDSSANIAKKITIANAFGIADYGWTASGESWTFSSFNSTLRTGVITVPSDATTKYPLGSKVKLTQSTGGTKYAKVVGVTSTTLTLQFPESITLNNEAITSTFYSLVENPTGFPANSSFMISYTSSGSGGGTGYMYNDNGVKSAWGTSGNFNSVAGANYNASVPSGFLSRVDSGSIFNPSSSAVISQVGSALTTTVIQQFIQTVSNNVRIAWFVRGV